MTDAIKTLSYLPLLPDERDALDRLEALVRAAEPIAGWDLRATQWIAGLGDLELRAMHADDVEKIIEQVEALAVALRAVKGEQA